MIQDSPLQLTPEERKRIVEALNGDIYKVVKIRLPVLLRLDEALSEGEAAYDYPIITVEHVLPQSPPEKSTWLEWWTDDDEREENVHRLGNLALLSRRKNSQAQNYEFDRKKKEYFQRKGVAPFALTTQVLNQQEWTRDVVMERQGQLVQKLAEVWELLRPMAYSSITLTNFSLAHQKEMLKLEKQIHSILCPKIEFNYIAYDSARSGVQADSAIARRWLNRKCDVQSMWCHIHYDGDVFVTGDKNFHKKTKKGQLIALGAGMICRPNEAVALLPSTVMGRQ